MSYSNGEAFDMLAVYFQYFENTAMTERVYAANYSDGKHFSRKVFSRLTKRLCETGQVHSILAARRKRPIRDENYIIIALAYIQVNPYLSTRAIISNLAKARHLYIEF